MIVFGTVNTCCDDSDLCRMRTIVLPFWNDPSSKWQGRNIQGPWFHISHSQMINNIHAWSGMISLLARLWKPQEVIVTECWADQSLCSDPLIFYSQAISDLTLVFYYLGWVLIDQQVSLEPGTSARDQPWFHWTCDPPNECRPTVWITLSYNNTCWRATKMGNSVTGYSFRYYPPISRHLLLAPIACVCSLTLLSHLFIWGFICWGRSVWMEGNW